MKKVIGVIGMGYVGSKIHDFFKNHGYETHGFDVDRSKGDVDSIENLNKSDLDFAFVCVPTPMADNGACDVSIVEESASRVVAKTIVIQSTVAPGTTKKMEQKTGKDILFVPEYFGETKNHFLNNLNSRTFFIIGGRPEVRKKLVALYKEVFDSKQVRFGFFDATQAEVIKYMDNSYLALKVLFCEEFFRICNALDIDYDEVREGWLMDPRIDPSHTFARKDGKPGFGGKCYPKDLSAIIEASKALGNNPELLDFALKYNNKLRG